MNETAYCVAEEAQYDELYDKFEIGVKLTWPVLIAVRDNEIIGVLGTHGEDRLIAGPLEVNIPGRTNVFVAAKLIFIHDELMKKMGIKKFYFYVEKGHHWIKYFEDMEIYNKVFENDEYNWYERVF